MGATQLQPKPLIYDYGDYRVFLRDSFAFEKRAGSSYRQFSARAGFKSPNFLKLVIENQRNLTIVSIRKIVKALRLGEEEASFFKHLVFMNQAATLKERSDFAEKLLRSKVYRELYPLAPVQLDYYREWFHIPIRELASRADFDEDPRWIARQLRGKVNETQVARALENLQALGLLSRDARGRLTPAQAHVTTGHEAVSSGVAQFHREMLRLAADSIDDTERAKREISSTTLLLSESSFAKLKELVREFRRTLLAEASTEGTDLRVYQISFALFPLTENPEDKSNDEEAA